MRKNFGGLGMGNEEARAWKARGGERRGEDGGARPKANHSKALRCLASHSPA